MIIPMNPENVRITIQLTSADFEAGAFAHDIDLQKLYDNRNSCTYEFVINYNGQQISNDYQLFYDDGTLYAAVFFPTNDGQMLKLTLAAGEGVITVTEPELPAVTSANNGQVLTVSSGAWAAADAPSGLPDPSAYDDGYLLTVVDGDWSIEPPSGPTVHIVPIVAVSASLAQMQMQAKQMYDAILNGDTILFQSGSSTSYFVLQSFSHNASTGEYNFKSTQSTNSYTAATDTDYPSYSR